MPDLGPFVDAAKLLKDVLADVEGKTTFPVGVEIENRSPYDLTITPDYPFNPSHNNPETQCGQTGAPSVVGPDSPPIRIYAATTANAKDVGAFDGHAIGLDGNTGCMSYQGKDSANNVLFTFVIGWFMGAGKDCQYSLLAYDSNDTGYKKPKNLWKPGGDLCAICSSFSSGWTTGSVSKQFSITVNGQTKDIQIITSPGGNQNGYSITVEVSEIGFKPAD